MNVGQLLEKQAEMNPNLGVFGGGINGALLGALLGGSIGGVSKLLGSTSPQIGSRALRGATIGSGLGAIMGLDNQLYRNRQQSKDVLEILKAQDRSKEE